MKTKLLTICLALVSCLGCVYADYTQKVTVDGLCYLLDEDTKTAKVTYQMQYSSNYSGLTTISIPETIIYNAKTFKVTSIGSSAFSDCSGLTSVTIPNSVTSIGSSAFSGCSGLTSVTIPNSVTIIGSSAFSGCSGLTSVTIPNSVTNIDGYAFSDCSGLTSITIPNSVTSIESYVFSGCGGLTSPIYNLHVFAYMPTLYSGTYTIPQCIELIAGGAFSDCSGLTSVTIPNSVTSIGSYAFYGCSGLTSVTIPNSVTSIGSYAFYGCSGLTSVAIPNSVTSIGKGAFAGCSGLPNIDNIRYADSYLVCVIDKNQSSYIIKEGTRFIGSSAFSDCSVLTSITIPNSVTSIGNSAFYGCSDLTSMTIPNSVTSIGNYAFYGCSGLTSVTIPNSVTSIGEGTFAGCTGLTSVTIPKGVADIGQEAFSDCVALKSITFGDNVKQIGKNAFYNCSSLNSFFFPNSVTIIDDNAFEECGNLVHLHFGDNLKILGSEVFMNCHNLRNFVLPESLQILRNKTFYGCNSIDSITIPTNVDSVGYAVLADCTNLRYIKWNAKHAICPFYEHTHNLCFLVNSSFQILGDIRDSIKTFEFGSQVEIIPQYLCYKMRNLDSLYIPQNIRIIGKKAFINCEKLRKIVVAENNETFDSRYNCNSIVKKDSSKLVLGSGCSFIPNDVAIIGMEAFSENKLITSIHIPSNVELIEGFAFNACNLQNIIIEEGVQQIWAGAFSSNQLLTEITFPSSVIVIGSSIFSFCDNLKKITYNNVIIGASMFYKCNGLTKIVIPNHVIEMREAAFSHCISLEEITIGKGLHSIPEDGFYSCDKLRKIDIGENIENISYNAFYECDSIKEIYVRPYDPPTGSGIEPKNQKNIKAYVPCGRMEAYASSWYWRNFNLTNDSILYNLTGLSNDTLAGYVKVTNELCNNSLEAVPYESYKFMHWSDGSTDNPRTIILTQDTTITAIFAPKRFIVTFVDDNDTILDSQEYEYGAMPVPPTDPVKTNDAQYTYTFAGWTPQIVTVQSDATYKATYASTLNKYTITFMSEESILSADLWEYGTTPIYKGETPTKAEDEKYTYTFEKWSPDIIPVVADATYMATYIATEKKVAIDNVIDKSIVPAKFIENGNIYILMPNGKKYSIIGELVK